MSEESYYAAVEDHFISRRGSPLFITPAEWHLVWKWEQAGIPLHVVKEGIDRVFERPASGRRSRKLGYCRQTVEAAFRRFREASLGGGAASGPSGPSVPSIEDPFDPTAHLVEIAGELERAASARPPEDGLGKRAAAAREEVLALSRSASLSGLADIEDRLSELERELVDEAERALADEARHARAEAEASLADYRDRMPAKVYAAALESARRRRLRARVGLPALTLLDR